MKVLSKEKRALKGTEGFGMALKINPAVFFGPTHMSRYCFYIFKLVVSLIIQCKKISVENNVFCIKKNAFSDTEAAGTMSSASVAIDLADSSRKSLESSLRDISQQSDKG